ncbi:RrF2 family transcriptional regulator [Lacisediminihabitans profunda]|uniref:Rrf2 family transcriptional regulator n=1 Tax=Lacisediminihabitans profunda TaxID=2594790 RepID=A0A5C8URZ1_9MICO|nr:Rrf2 family transcriptional regulator [Lacisediminihabitans profunda]TXN30346.1 Rrf2 family transcriptional regulator [Lacisediminihabitans profunda]
MRINAFSDVCLRVVMLLAASPEGALMTSRAISEAIATPYNHVSKAVLRLRELGLVEVARGRAGGVRISAAGRVASIGWLLRKLDTRLDLAACETPAGPCPLLDGCGVRGALRRAREAFYSELDGIVISSQPHNQPATRVFY